MDDKQTQYDWIFGLRWFVTCAVGAAVGGALAFASMWTIGEAASQAANENVGGIVAGLLFGGLLSLGANLGPGLLLGRRGVSAGRWIAFSSIIAAGATGTAFAIAFSISDSLPEPSVAVLMGMTLGLPIGLIQGVLLRRSGLAASEWPVISVVAYLLVAAVIMLTSGEDTNAALAISLMGLVLGAVTALGMVWIRRQQVVAA